MSKVQMLRSLVEQRLTAAAEEIFGLFERTIAEYEEELCRTKEENQRKQQLLDTVLNPKVQIHTTDVHQLPVVKEEVPPEHQDWSPSLDQDDPHLPRIKEEQEELRVNEEGEQLQELLQLIPVLEGVSTVASPESQPSSLDSSDSQHAFIFSDSESPSRKRQRMDSEAMQLVESILTTKPGGERIINEYNRTKTLVDVTRRKMVNILAADMTEKNGTSPSREVKEMYARGIVNLFPNLRDPFSKNGYEHYYDADSGTGYLAWRIKTIQRCTAKDRRASFRECVSTVASPESQPTSLDLSDSQDTFMFSDSESPSRKRQRMDSEAMQLVESILTTKPGGERIINEYNRTKTLVDVTRRKMVNILAADMTEKNGTSPSREVKEMYARGIVNLFPNLRDPFSKNGYEHYYDAESGTGYLAWRIKTIQRCTPKDRRASFRRNTAKISEKKCMKPLVSTYGEDVTGGPTVRRESQFVPVTVLSEADCKEAIALMKHSADVDTVKKKMKMTFVHRRNMVLDPQQASSILSEFPRFKDVKGLVEQDFVLMFGEGVSGKLLERWSTTFKKKIIHQCRKLPSISELGDLLQAADPPHDGTEVDANVGWDSDLSSVLLLSHLIPPTAQGRKRPGKVSASQAEKHLVVFKKTGTNIQEHLDAITTSSHPHLLAVGVRKSAIHQFFIVLDKMSIPCRSTSSLGAFDELFKAHFVFGKSYTAVLHNMYTFIQTTVYNIDVGKVKESPRVAEVRARLLH